jgi:hypothetical protein
MSRSPHGRFSLRPAWRWLSVCDTGYDSFDQEIEILGRSGYSLELFPGDRLDSAGKAVFARGAAGMLVRWTTVDGAFFDAASTFEGHRALRSGV